MGKHDRDQLMYPPDDGRRIGTAGRDARNLRVPGEFDGSMRPMKTAADGLESGRGLSSDAEWAKNFPTYGGGGTAGTRSAQPIAATQQPPMQGPTFTPSGKALDAMSPAPSASPALWAPRDSAPFRGSTPAEIAQFHATDPSRAAVSTAKWTPVPTMPNQPAGQTAIAIPQQYGGGVGVARGPNDWQKDIVAKHPAIGNAGSPLNRQFTAAWASGKYAPGNAMDLADSISDPNYTPKKPVSKTLIAARNADDLGETKDPGLLTPTARANVNTAVAVAKDPMRSAVQAGAQWLKPIVRSGLQAAGVTDEGIAAIKPAVQQAGNVALGAARFAFPTLGARAKWTNPVPAAQQVGKRVANWWETNDLPGSRYLTANRAKRPGAVGMPAYQLGQ